MALDGSRIARLANQAFNSNERKNFEALWELITEFMIPNQYTSFAGTDTRGAKKTRRLFDSTGIKANQDLAATIHSTLTNPATQWTKMRYSQEELNNDPESVAWLESVTKILHKELNESNFDTEISKFYQLFPALATSVLFHEEKELNSQGRFDGFLFRAVHLSEVTFSENIEGRVDTIFRKFPLTARQAVERFGLENVSDKIKDKVKVNPDEQFQFIHAVFPRDPKEVSQSTVGVSDPKERAFASVYVDCDTHEIMEEGGYFEFPMHVVRWETLPGEAYGRGPGLIALPEVRTLNKLKEHALHQQAMALRPPLLASQRSIMGDLNLRAGAVSIVKDVNEVRELTTAARFDVAQFAAQEIKDAIKEIFFLDKLFLPPREEIGEMTAFEASKRIEQMQRVIGPTIARISNELLQPLIVRCFKMLLRGGALPEPPAALANIDLDVEITFLNQLARAQQFEDVTNIQSLAQQIGLLAQLNPEAVDYLDVDEAVKHIAKIMGVPEKVITNDDEVAETREARAQQAQAAQALEAGVAMADIQSKTQGSQGGGQ